ncbi:unnamed protein product [Sphagnum compactum]
MHGRTSSMALAASSSSFSVVSYQQHLASRGLNQRLRNGCGDVRNCVSFICCEEGELKASSYDSGASCFLRSGRRRDRRRRRRRIVSGSATMGEESETQHQEGGFGNWIQFPKLSTAGRTLMEDVARSMDRELEPLIHPSFTAPDVRHFTGGSGEGSVTLRAGKEGSKIDFLLGSWLHCNLPFGTLNIATLIVMLNAEADSPHLLFEFIQSGPSNLVLVLDLLPRKDLVLEPEYLQRFYESTGLENIKQEFEKSPQAQPYLSTALYIRSVVSPTALLYKLSGEGAEGGLDAVITQLVHPAAKNVFNTWLNAFQNLGHKLNDNEKLHVMKRDEQIKTKGVEVDLSGNMPQLFGQDVADRVLKAFQKGE